jgi:RNA recognition motif-containing protein
MNIYIGNLSYQAMDNDLRKLFTEFGEVKTAKVVMDAYTHRSRGFGFVEMTERSAGEKAVMQLHNLSFMQKSLIVNEANDKSPRK